MTWRVVILIASLTVLAVPISGRAAEPLPGFCKADVSDDTLRSLPAALTDRARRIFRLDMPDAMIERTVVYRCMNGRIMFCATGANLACGKANVSRDLPGVAAWCRDHPTTDNVPMFVTGHDTIYRWRCNTGKSVVAGVVSAVDPRGFLAENWKFTDR